MATYFVRGTTGVNTNNASDWNNARQSVASALSLATTSGDIVVVDNLESFTPTAAITWAPSLGVNVSILSVTRSGTNSWTKSPGAVEGIGGASLSTFTLGGVNGSHLYVYGMRINGSTGSSTAAIIALLGTANVSSYLTMESCTFDIKTVTSACALQLGATALATSRSASIVLRNCTVIISASRGGAAVTIGDASCEIVNLTCSFLGATKPQGIFGGANLSDTGQLTVRDSDWSDVTSALTVLTNWGISSLLAKNCILTGGNISLGVFTAGVAGSITLRNCIRGAVLYPYYRSDITGVLTVSTATFADDGAVVDGAPVSWQIVTTASCTEGTPFVVPLLEEYADTTGAKTVDIEVFRDNATALTDRQIWSEIEYPGADTYLYDISTTRNADPFTGAAAAQPASAVTWTNAAVNPNPQKLDHSFTLGFPGLIQGRVMIGVASTTVFLNPVLSGL